MAAPTQRAAPIPSVVTATILAGESLSSAVDLTAATPVAIYVPSTWQSAIVTFQMGDGQFFGDLFDRMAREVSVNVEAGTVVQINPDNSLGALFLKLRSGSRSNPIVQSVQQDFKVFIVK
jgi:hypothetical protein